jgi:hypothetical protein
MADNLNNFPGKIYAPPGPYTQTFSQPATATTPDLNRVPTYIGTGNEILSIESQELVRGSSARVDQEIVDEDVSGRLVVEITIGGEIILGPYDGVGSRVQVRHYPIVNGNGTGTVSNDRSRVAATVNGEPVVVLAVEGLRGLVTLGNSIGIDDEVRITYFFKRKDTQLTDDVSEQVTSTPAIIEGEIGLASGDTFEIIENFNDTLLFSVDNIVETSIVIAEGDYTPSQIAALITGADLGTLSSAAFTNNEGKIAVRLQSDHSLQIGNGSANGVFGFVSGDRTTRANTFYTFNGPIVDGTNGGVTTTDPSKVTVKVNNIPVVVTAVDGTNRAVSIALPPAVGDTVEITYYINTWQDTYDYLPVPNVVEITRCGLTPGRKDYVQGVDFILKDDLIIWGSATVVSTGITTENFAAFGASQVSSTLVDQRDYLSICEPVVNTSTNPPTQSRKDFQLQFVPTTGNGRNTPLSANLFNTISNNRQDLATARPDLISAYWGYSLQDALDRGPVPITVVNPNTRTITLKDPVPTNALVWATLYYNNLLDGTYTLSTVIPGATGVGVYTVTDSQNNSLYNVNLGTKSPALTGVTLVFPRGSEFYPDARIESNNSAVLAGPVDEVVTVTFAETGDSPAKYSVDGPGSYYFVDAASDRLRLTIDGVSLASGAAGLDLSNPTGVASGFFASLLGSEVVYDASTGGATYTIATEDKDLSVNVDGIVINSSATVGAGATAQAYVDALNTAAVAGGTVAPKYKGATRFTSAFIVAASEYDRLNFHFTGDVVGLSGLQTLVLTPGTYNSVNALITEINTQIGLLTPPSNATGSYTLAVPIVGNTVTIGGTVFTGVASVRTIGGNNFDVRPAAQATATITVTAPVLAGEIISINGIDLTAVSGAPGVDEFDISSGVSNTIASNINTAVNAGGNSFTGTATGGVLGNVVTLTAVPVGELGNVLTLTTTDAVGLTISGPLFTGGIDATNDAESLTAAINDALNWTGDAPVTALQAGAVVNLTAVVPGITGNTITITSNSGNIVPSGATLTGAVAGFSGDLTVSADSSGRLTFALEKGTFNNSGFLEFITDTTATRDFATLAGIDTAASVGSTQTKLYDGPIATRFTVGSAPLLYDRIILRNRLMPGSGSIAPYHNVAQTQLKVLGSGSSDKIGFVSQQTGMAGYQAVIQAPTLFGSVGFAGGQGASGQPTVVFYNGTGVNAANNVFKFTMDNTSVTVTFTSSTNGTATELGPVATATTVLNQIAVAMAAAGFGGGVTATVISQLLVRQEGAGIRLKSPRVDQIGSILIGNGNANTVLGFVEGVSSFRTPVDTKVVASALMSNAQAPGDIADWILDPSNTAATYFAAEALAGVVLDEVNAEYLYLQSRTLGSSSSIAFVDPTQHSALLPGTRLIDSVGDGSVGEDGISGYYVTSNDSNDGSGTVNDSIFNSGVGQDGFVGQTYRDKITGLTFTILPRDSGDYPVGSFFTFVVSKNILTNGNLPIRAIPGVEVLVTSTAGTNVGDTALVENFEKSGEEPGIGEIYYISLNYTKSDYQHRLFTRLDTIQNTYGALSPNNPVTLAAYLAILNGATVVGIKQIPKGDTGFGTTQDYLDALVELEQPFEGGVLPTILTPLTGGASSLPFFRELSKHVDQMSSIRFKKERTAIIGVSPITTADDAITIATDLESARIIFVYPDSVLVLVPNNTGGQDEFLVEGFYLAAALAGSASSGQTDVATPLTNRVIKGFKKLGRRLNDTQANRIAQNGVTIMVEDGGNIIVRHELTTNMENINTQLPTVTWISDEVQKRARLTLKPLIGTKFLEEVINEINSRINNMYDQMELEELITDHRGVSSAVDPNNPTIARTNSYFRPVYPLLYIIAQFNLRTNIS